MMMVLQVISATGGNDVEVVMSPWPTLSRCYTGTVKLIVGIVHLIDSENGFEAALVESLVMCHQRQSLYERLYLLPHFGEDWSVLCVFCR